MSKGEEIMDECREAFEKWYCEHGTRNRDADFIAWQASWQATQEQTIRHAYNAGVAWGFGSGMNIQEYLEAQK